MDRQVVLKLDTREAERTLRNLANQMETQVGGIATKIGQAAAIGALAVGGYALWRSGAIGPVVQSAGAIASIPANLVGAGSTGGRLQRGEELYYPTAFSALGGHPAGYDGRNIMPAVAGYYGMRDFGQRVGAGITGSIVAGAAGIGGLTLLGRLLNTAPGAAVTTAFKYGGSVIGGGLAGGLVTAGGGLASGALRFLGFGGAANAVSAFSSTAARGAAAIGSKVGTFVGGALPFVLGMQAIGAAANAIIDNVTIQRQVEDAIERASQRYTFGNASNIATGRGWDARTQADIARFVRRDLLNREFLRQADFAEIFEGIFEANLDFNVRSAEDFKNKFTKVTQVLVNISRQLETTLEEAVKFLGEIQRSGFYTVADQAEQLWRTTALARYSGLSNEQMLQAYQIGSTISRSYGFHGSLGALIQSNVLATIQRRPEYMAPLERQQYLENIQEIGGSEQLATSVTQLFMNMANDPLINLAMYAMTDTESMTINPELFARFISGELDLVDLQKIATQKIATQRDYEQFLNRRHLVYDSLESGAQSNLFFSTMLQLYQGHMGYQEMGTVLRMFGVEDQRTRMAIEQTLFGEPMLSEAMMEIEELQRVLMNQRAIGRKPRGIWERYIAKPLERAGAWFAQPFVNLYTGIGAFVEDIYTKHILGIEKVNIGERAFDTDAIATFYETLRIGEELQRLIPGQLQTRELIGAIQSRFRERGLMESSIRVGELGSILDDTFSAYYSGQIGEDQFFNSIQSVMAELNAIVVDLPAVAKREVVNLGKALEEFSQKLRGEALDFDDVETVSKNVADLLSRALETASQYGDQEMMVSLQNLQTNLAGLVKQFREGKLSVEEFEEGISNVVRAAKSGFDETDDIAKEFERVLVEISNLSFDTEDAMRSASELQKIIEQVIALASDMGDVTTANALHGVRQELEALIDEFLSAGGSISDFTKHLGNLADQTVAYINQITNQDFVSQIEDVQQRIAAAQDFASQINVPGNMGGLIQTISDTGEARTFDVRVRNQVFSGVQYDDIFEYASRLNWGAMNVPDPQDWMELFRASPSGVGIYSALAETLERYQDRGKALPIDVVSLAFERALADAKNLGNEAAAAEIRQWRDELIRLWSSGTDEEVNHFLKSTSQILRSREAEEMPKLNLLHEPIFSDLIDQLNTYATGGIGDVNVFLDNIKSTLANAKETAAARGNQDALEAIAQIERQLGGFTTGILAGFTPEELVGEMLETASTAQERSLDSLIEQFQALFETEGFHETLFSSLTTPRIEDIKQLWERFQQEKAPWATDAINALVNRIIQTRMYEDYDWFDSHAREPRVGSWIGDLVDATDTKQNLWSRDDAARAIAEHIHPQIMERIRSEFGGIVSEEELENFSNALWEYMINVKEKPAPYYLAALFNRPDKRVESEPLKATAQDIASQFLSLLLEKDILSESEISINAASRISRENLEDVYKSFLQELTEGTEFSFKFGKKTEAALDQAGLQEAIATAIQYMSRRTDSGGRHHVTKEEYERLLSIVGEDETAREILHAVLAFGQTPEGLQRLGEFSAQMTLLGIASEQYAVDAVLRDRWEAAALMLSGRQADLYTVNFGASQMYGQAASSIQAFLERIIEGPSAIEELQNEATIAALMSLGGFEEIVRTLQLGREISTALETPGGNISEIANQIASQLERFNYIDPESTIAKRLRSATNREEIEEMINSVLFSVLQSQSVTVGSNVIYNSGSGILSVIMSNQERLTTATNDVVLKTNETLINLNSTLESLDVTLKNLNARNTSDQ